MAKIKVFLLIIILKVITAAESDKVKCGIDAEISKYHKEECFCREGFFGDPYKECIKIPDDVCKHNPCGNYSVCFDDKYHHRVQEIGPYCLCQSNTYGSPPNCQLRCKYDEKCKSDEFCSRKSGQCETGCRSDHSTCETEEYCDRDENTCIKGCRCHETCSDEERCFKGKCIERCRSREDCAENEFCDGALQVCQPICSESKCGPNSICTQKDDRSYCSCKNDFIPEHGFGCRPQKSNELIAELENKQNEPEFCSKFCGDFSYCEILKNQLYCFCSSEKGLNPLKTCKLPHTRKPPINCECCSAHIKPGCEGAIDPNLLKSLIG